MSRNNTQAAKGGGSPYGYKRSDHGAATNRRAREMERRRRGLEAEVKKLEHLLDTKIEPISFNLAAKPAARRVTVRLTAISMEGEVLVGGRTRINLIKDLSAPPCRLSQMPSSMRLICKPKDLHQILKRFPVPQT